MNNWIIQESCLDECIHLIYPKMDDKVNMIVGPVCSGKTILLLYKCRQLLSANSYANVIWIVNNALYKEFLLLAFAGFGLRIKIETLFDFFKHDKRTVDYVFVDEASFLTESNLQSIVKSVRQSLYIAITEGNVKTPFFFKEDKKGLNAERMSSILNVTPYELQQSYVNNDVGKLLSSLYELDSSLSENKYGYFKPRCRYKELSTEDSVIDFIKEYIIKCSEENLGILFLSNDEVEQAYQEFRNLKFEVESKYNSVGKWKNNINFASSIPKLLTIHSCAGISFETIFIVLNKKMISRFSEYKDLFAYALTRGRSNVVIVSNASLPDVIKENAISLSEKLSISI